MEYSAFVLWKQGKNIVKYKELITNYILTDKLFFSSSCDEDGGVSVSWDNKGKMYFDYSM